MPNSLQGPSGPHLCGVAFCSILLEQLNCGMVSARWGCRQGRVLFPLQKGIKTGRAGNIYGRVQGKGEEWVGGRVGTLRVDRGGTSELRVGRGRARTSRCRRGGAEQRVGTSWLRAGRGRARDSRCRNGGAWKCCREGSRRGAGMIGTLGNIRWRDISVRGRAKAKGCKRLGRVGPGNRNRERTRSRGRSWDRIRNRSRKKGEMFFIHRVGWIKLKIINRMIN